jgi:beta-lactamase superfamily II metal-dependent hydrolase
MTIGIDCIENSALPEKNAGLEDITTEQITTIGTICGYVLRLRDGRFVIFDGGQTDSHAKVIYDILTAQNVREGKPVIAAWFLTHGHSDHINGLRSFIAKYSKNVIVENFVHNLPAFEQYDGKNTQEINPSQESQGLYDRSVAYYNDVEKYYPKANIIVARAGQRFEYGTLAIDVLFTPENLYKKQMLDTNASSVVYSITGDSGRMLVLGDLVDPEGGVLNAIYEEELDCDLVQVAHHGYNNGNEDMYDSINADYAFWTAGLEDVVSSNRHIQATNPRNQFDYKSVYANIIPSSKGPNITLTEGMTKAQMIALDVGLTG